VPALVIPPADLGLEPLNFRCALPGKSPRSGGLALNFREWWPGSLPKWTLKFRSDTRCHTYLVGTLCQAAKPLLCTTRAGGWDSLRPKTPKTQPIICCRCKSIYIKVSGKITYNTMTLWPSGKNTGWEKGGCTG